MPIYSSLSLWLFRASWQASILIVLVLLAQWVFRSQLTPRWRYRLWLLVVIRLMMPFSPESGWSIFNYIKAGREPEKILGTTADHRADAAVGRKAAVSTNLSAGTTSSATGDNIPPFATSNQSKQAWMAVLRRFWLPATMFAWLAGLLMLPVHLLISSIGLARKIGRQRSMTNPAVLGLLEDCKQLMDVRAPLVVIETNEITSPALYAFIRPRLLLPLGLADRFTKQDLRFVFLHELAHIKRHDIAMNWVMTALQTLHWFNPLVWVAFRRMRADREQACDELALAYAREDEAIPYGHTIIKLLEVAQPATAPSLMGILEDRNELKQRIGMIAQFRRTHRWPVLAVALLTGLVLFCLTDAKNAQSTTLAEPGVSVRATAGNPTDMADSLRNFQDETSTSIPNRTSDGISLLVLDADTENAIPHASIRADFHLLKERRWLHVTDITTDAHGMARVQFPTNSYEAVYIYFNAPHHVPRLVNWGWDGSLAPRGYCMWLHKGARIGGKVLDEDGQPIAGVTIIVRGPSFEQATIGSEGYGFQNAVNWVTTDASGKWSCDQVPANFGEFMLIVEHPDYAKTTFSTDRNSRAPGYLPKAAMSALWAEKATLVLQRGQTITGLVTDRQDRPVPRAEVRRGTLETTADETGHFHFYHVVPGKMGLNASADGYTETAAKFRITNNMPEIHLQLDEAIVLSGRVADAKGRPVSGATVLLGKNRYQVMEHIHTSDKQGRFSFTHIPKNGGNLVLTVEAEGFAPELTILPRKPGGSDVRIQLTKGRVLKGLVVDNDGRPVVNVDVSVLSWRARQTLLWHDRTDATGRFCWNSAPAEELQGLIGHHYYGSAQRDAGLMAFPFKAGENEQTFTLQQGLLQSSAER